MIIGNCNGIRGSIGAMMVCLNYAFNVDINTINATISTVGTSRLFIGNCNGIGGSISAIIGFLDCSFAAVIGTRFLDCSFTTVVGTSNMRIGTVGISALLEITMGIETAVVISLEHELLPLRYHVSLLDAAAVLPFHYWIQRRCCHFCISLRLHH